MRSNCASPGLPAAGHLQGEAAEEVPARWQTQQDSNMKSQAADSLLEPQLRFVLTRGHCILPSLQGPHLKATGLF